MNIHFNFIIYSFLFLVIFFSSKKKYKFSRYFNFLIITLIPLWIIHPYWLLGESSSIGWYDEIDLTIFNFLTLSDISEKKIQDQFSLFMAGGTNILETFYLTKINYLVILKLIKLFPEYISFSIYRFFSIFFYLIGFYYFLIKTKLIKSNDYFSLIFFSSLSLFSMPYEYGWAFGGTGFLYASIIWLLNIVLFNNNKKQFLLLFIFAFSISIIGVSPIYFFPCSLSFIIIYIFYKKIKLSFNNIFNLISFYIFYFYLNFDLFDLLKAFDARFIETSEVNKTEQVVFTIKQILIFFSQGLDLFKNENFQTGNLFPLSFFVNFSVFSFLILVSIIIKKYRGAAIAIVYVLLIFIFQILIIFLPSELDIIKPYSYSYVYIFTYPFIIIILATYIKELETNSKFTKFLSLYKIILTLIIVLGISFMNQRSINSAKEYGSWEVAKSKKIYDFLYKKYKNNNFRAISINNNPKISFLYYNQINTFDGLRFNHENNKSLFFKKLNNNSTKLKDNTRHVVRDLKKLDFKLLSIAGVKVILSKEKLVSQKINFLKKIKLKNGKSYISYYIYEINEVSWDLVFTADNIMIVQNYEDENFYNQLKNSSHNSILVKKNDYLKLKKFSKNNLKINNFEIKLNRIELITNNMKGIIVLNFVTNKKLNYYCDNKREYFKSIQVNSIMNAIDINKNCKKISVIFN